MMTSIRRRQDLSSDRSQLEEGDSAALIPNNHTSDGSDRSDLKGDRGNIALLFLLYLLQGIPLGLTQAIPMLLQNRGVTYAQQAEFSFAIFPFSLKLIYAPIVDSLYFNKFGRRKSWLIPTQYLIGLFMMLLSFHVNTWLGETDPDTKPNISLLTIMFFTLNLLAATQDIAVDGWALTMLKRCNVGHASTCNSVGQTAGYFLGYVAFIALESKDFCNSYLRTEPQPHGLITLPYFLWFWGICFFVTTTLVALFKKETSGIHLKEGSYEDNLNVLDSYKILWKIIRMRPIQILAILLLTVKVSFAASDAVSSLKLIDAGVPKDQLALLAIPMIPLQIVLPLFISQYTNGPKPMNIYIKAIPYRIIFTILATLIVYLTPEIINANNHIVPKYYYVLLITIYGFYQICLYSMFVAVMAFFAKISDPGIGGTYMTLLNTICNLGGNWPNTVVLWLVDSLTWKECVLDSQVAQNSTIDVSQNKCLNNIESDQCIAGGGKCDILIDGYYVEALFCAIYGFIWIYFARKWIYYLQNLPTKQWLVVKSQNSKES